MSRIRILPESVINQIAAGEVVERPASVVKELLENALDAGARRIRIEVEEGGRRRIRVADDGEGMAPDEALLALERHATSKLKEASDLAEVATLGFRGEALPSIASVSRLVVESSTDGSAGTRIEVEAGRVGRVVPAGHPKGTTVDVRDLFFNTPARSRFLKSPAAELAQIQEIVAAIAAAAPAVHLSLEHEGRTLVECPAVATLLERVIDLQGEAWRRARPIDLERPGLRARGMIAPPEEGGSARRLQHLFVNGRWVKDRVIAHAIASAAEGFLPKGRHAPVFLFLECPRESVDVNVHPAKAEVRFRESRRIHEFVHTAIRAALASSMPIPGIAHEGAGSAPPLHEAAARYLAWEERGSAVAAPPRTLPDLPAAGSPSLERMLEVPPRAIGQYANAYIVACDAEGLLLVDQHAAHERVVFEQLLGCEQAGMEGSMQELLFPASVPWRGGPGADADRTLSILRALGFDAEPGGPHALMIRAAPAPVEASRVPSLVTDLLRQIDDEDAPGALSLGREPLLATIACHSSVRAGMPLGTDRMNYVIKELFRTQAPLKCPHGRPTILRFAHAAIERGFGR